MAANAHALIPALQAQVDAMPALGADMLHLFNLCGILPGSLTTSLRLEGINDIDSFKILDAGSFTDMSKRLASRQLNRGGNLLNAVQVTKLEGVRHWIQDLHKRGQDINPTEDLDAAALLVAIEENRVHKLASKDADKVDGPGRFKPKDWVTWELKLTNHLASRRGVGGFPLSYVIRKDIPDGEEVPEGMEKLYQAPLTGAAFRADTQAVHRTIIDSLVDTEGHEWVGPVEHHQSGRRTMEALRNHYDGPDGKTRRIAAAQQQISSLHYKGEAAMPFDTFTARLSQAYRLLKDNGEVYTELTKVTTMLKKINNSHPQLQAAINDARKATLQGGTFAAAVSDIAGTISHLFPTTIDRNGRRRVASVKNKSKHTYKNKTNKPYDKSKYPYGKSFRGVDIEDVTRYFPSDEWEKLTGEVRYWLHNHPDRIAAVAQSQERRRIRAAAAEAARSIPLPPPPPPPPAGSSTGNGQVGATRTTPSGFGRGAYTQS